MTGLRLLYSSEESDAGDENDSDAKCATEQLQKNINRDSCTFDGSKTKCSEMLFAEEIVCETENLLAGNMVSDLTFQQYQSMDPDCKLRLHNRVRQWALKARNALPNEHGLFVLVVSHLLKNAHRYFKLDHPYNLQEHILEGNSICESTRNKIIQDFKETNKKVRQIGLLKSKNRLKEQEQLVVEMKGDLQSLHNIAKRSGISKKMVQQWFSRPKIKTHKSSDIAQLKKAEFEQFLLQDSISFAHPSKKFAGKRFLRDTLEVTRKKYLEQSEYHRNGIISLSSMKAYRPPYILLCCQTPLDQCLCDKCENCELLLRALSALGVKNIPANRYCAVDGIVCSVRYRQDGSSLKFPKLQCIQGSCVECGEKSLKETIYALNHELINENRTITWRQWGVQKNKATPAKFQVKASLRQGVDQLIEILKPLKSHIFRANWNRNVFEHVRKNLCAGQGVQIFDFAMNFRYIHQDEIQSAYWQGSQTSIHTVINYFPCENEGCSDVVTVILAQITADLQHDSFVARAAHNAAFQYLAHIGIPMEIIMQFCDNCSAQYKSRRPFAELSRSALQIIRVYFGEKHGKSVCDGFFGRLKSWVTHKIKTRQVIISNATDFYRCCKAEYETQPAENRDLSTLQSPFPVLDTTKGYSPTSRL